MTLQNLILKNLLLQFLQLNRHSLEPYHKNEKLRKCKKNPVSESIITS